MEKATAFAHKTHDAGLWTKLLEKSWKETTIAAFFVVDIAEGCLHTAKCSKLCLPAGFLEKYHTHLTENVTLEGPDGQKWAVMLGLSWERKPCFLQGWQEFAVDYKLAVRDQIVFFLWEDSHFLFQVFDAHRNIKRRGDELNNEAKTADAASERAELANTQAPGGDEEGNPGTEANLTVGRPSSAPAPANCAIASDADEEVLRLKRSRKLNRKSTESREGDELHTASFERLQGLFKLAQDMKETGALYTGTSNRREGPLKLAQSMQETAALHGNIAAEGSPEAEPAAVSVPKPKPKLATSVAEDKKPLQARSRKLPTEVTAGKGAHKRKRRARGMKSRAPVDDQEGPETRAKARNNPKASSLDSSGKEPEAEACPPLSSPPPEQAAKPSFKRPKPRILPAGLSVKLISNTRPASMQEKEAALASSHEYARKSINPNFVMQMRILHVYYGLYLPVPSGFAQAMLLPPVRMKVTLFDVTGKTWAVDWMGDHPAPGLDSAGWTTFVVEHSLDEGDVCVFELPDPKVFNISVEIFKAVP